MVQQNSTATAESTANSTTTATARWVGRFGSPHMPTEGICGPPVGIDGSSKIQRQRQNQRQIQQQRQRRVGWGVSAPHTCQQKAYVGHPWVLMVQQSSIARAKARANSKATARAMRHLWCFASRGGSGC